MLELNHTSNCHRTDPDKKDPRRLPQEWPDNPEHYTEEITASDRSHHPENYVTIDHIELLNAPYEVPLQADFSRNAVKLSEAETDPNPGKYYSDQAAKQTADYHTGNKAAPNNNLFFEERSNPLSSKGN